MANRPACYQLGCDASPPREAVAFRIQELLGREYGVRSETIGGIGPSDDQADFVASYNRVMSWLMQRRYGQDFLQRLEKRAEGDVFTRRVEFVGEINFFSHALQVAPRTIYRFSGSSDVLALAKALDGRIVRITGTMIDIRDSKWREWGYASIETEQIRSEATFVEPRDAALQNGNAAPTG